MQISAELIPQVFPQFGREWMACIRIACDSIAESFVRMMEGVGSHARQQLHFWKHCQTSKQAGRDRRKTVLRLHLLAGLLLTAPLSALASSTSDAELKPQCGGPFQLCGYVEKEGETLRIPQKFEVAQPFSEGLAAVRIDGLFGFINPRGEIVVSPRFQSASSFSGGYAEVRIDNASGAIDRSGRLVVPAQFQRLIHFFDGTFIAEPLPDNPSSQSSQTGRLETLSESIMLSGRRAAGLYHRDRGWLTDSNLEFSIFDEPQRGLIWAGRRNEQGEDQWGLLNADGSWRVSPRYQHVQRVMETHAVVNAPTRTDLPPIERRETIRWGAVDRSGNLIVPLEFAYLSYWRGGYGYAKEGKPYGADGRQNDVREGIVKADGSLLGGRYFDEVDIREDGTLPRARLGETWRSVTPSGQLIPDQLDSEPLVECESGLGIFRRGEEVEFRVAARAVGRFDNIYFSKRDCPGPFSARRSDRWFYVLENGTVLGGADGFQETYSFSRRTHVPVKVGGKWGIIDRTGSFSVRPRFSKLRPDRNNTFAVGEGEDTYWINASGNRVEQPVAERPSPQQALTCEGGLRFFQRGDLWGFQDQSGQTVIEPRFRALSCFQQGVSWAVEPGSDGWCAIGPDGARREAMECSGTYYPIRVSHHYPEKFDDDPFESSVLWNRAWLDYQAGNRDGPPTWVGDGVMSGVSYSVSGGGPGGPGSLGMSIGSSQFIAKENYKIAAFGIGAIFLAGIGILFWKRSRKASDELGDAS